MIARRVLGMRVDCLEAPAARDMIVAWAAETHDAGYRPRYICAGNVHMTMETYDDPAFRAAVNRSDLVVADGQPLVWALRALRAPQRRRVRVTPDLLLELFAACEVSGVRLGLYGGTPQTLSVFLDFLQHSFPRLQVPYAWSPPFKPPTDEEDEAAVAAIRAAGVQLLLVGTGCPKQEKWMAAHAGEKDIEDDRALSCVMFGVGAAFDLLGGKTSSAPRWMQDLGLEWAYRLAHEPRRLWRRQLKHNPRFVVLFLAQLLRGQRA